MQSRPAAGQKKPGNTIASWPGKQSHITMEPIPRGQPAVKSLRLSRGHPARFALSALSGAAP